jgi:hypothetical protein
MFEVPYGSNMRIEAPGGDGLCSVPGYYDMSSFQRTTVVSLRPRYAG